MTRYLLDTSIIGALTQQEPAPALLAWMADRSDEDLFVTAFSVMEIWRAVLAAPRGGHSEDLRRWLSGAEGPEALFAGRVLSFDDRAARIWARLMAESSALGTRRSGLDMIVAAIAEANDCIVVTDNEAAYAGLPIVNPTRPES
ncbi:MAG TPA: PIN domain-containing protein [Vineibacter sp.]|nr:PIN domain-containing protein [Vineibacter sp.]